MKIAGFALIGVGILLTFTGLGIESNDASSITGYLNYIALGAGVLLVVVSK